MKKVYVFLFFLCILSGSVAGQKLRTSTAAPQQGLLETILDSLRKKPSMAGVRIKMKNINFETNSAAIKPVSKVYLDTIASVLNQLPSIVFEITGHTDNVGNAEANRKLSLNRAKSVRDYLVTIGRIRASRVSFQGYGSLRPVATNKTEFGKSQNRRVEMEFVGLDQTQKNEILFMNGQKEEVLFIYRDDANKKILYKLNESSPLLEVKTTEVSQIRFADGTSVVFQPIVREEIKQKFDDPTGDQNLSFTPSAPKPRKAFGVTVYGEGLYVIESLSKNWSDLNTGIGMLQGFGGGIQLSYFLTSKVGVTFQTGFSQWQVERKYVSMVPEKILQFTAEDKVTRIPLQVGLKLYPIRNIYFNPFGGGQLTKRTTKTSELHPNGLQTITTKGFIPAVGAAIGFEKYFGPVFLDVAAQYHYILNKDFSEITDPLHFAGLRIGIGFKSKEIK
ncbi:Peptidoglycan-associated lipoprotein [Dyadobacter sp. CECT 9275]|uniref:Peptidoglycan-associated lipoprotein n=1 Tax=Dyadobacter helix TaxID=2822344 RepID=A0A916N7J7_9BACT|nr:OmpA family protein [Dyadobacter sp. CECT 9275]CAG5009135.1 Peptidoglycan-associated lipoprotein [Dyadobacter sp. CECT 9275]